MPLSDMVKFALTNFANDGRSSQGVARLRDLAIKGTDISSIEQLSLELQKGASNQISTPIPLRALRLLSPVLPYLLLPFYYLTTVISSVPYFLQGLGKGNKFQIAGSQKAWEEVLTRWGRYPQSYLIKSLEARYYWKEAILSPSLEVGVYRGDTSRVAFQARQIDAGMEFVPQNILQYLADGSPVHRHLMSGDVYNLPFKDNSFNTVFFIHSFDDIQRGAEKAASEFARVLKPGGKLVFSSYSEYFGEHNVLISYLRKRGKADLAKMVFDTVYLATDNIFSRREWTDMMSSVGLNIERYEEFFPLKAAKIMDLPFRLEGYIINLFNFHDAFQPLRKGIAAGLYRRWLQSVAAGVQHADGRENSRGINFFAVARKAGPSPASEPYDFWRSLRCPVCLQGGFNSPPPEEAGLASVACQQCNTKFPLVFGLPILHAGAGWTE